jgi:uncharacterized membrane protein
MESLFKLCDILINEVGIQHEYKSQYQLSGDGWWISAQSRNRGISAQSRTRLITDPIKWELYIQDDNLALMFKLKWL